MNSLKVTLRAATPADEPFLFDLRKATMDEHLKRAGEPTDERIHWERLRYRYTDAQIVCCGSERLGLFKAFRDAEAWTRLSCAVGPGPGSRGGDRRRAPTGP